MPTTKKPVKKARASAKKPVSRTVKPKTGDQNVFFLTVVFTALCLIFAIVAAVKS